MTVVEQQLNEFRRTHQIQTRKIDGKTWYYISSESFAFWHGGALILESNRERVSPQERVSVETLFANKLIHVFRNAGNLSFITHTKEFAETVAHFLNAQK